MTSRVRPKMLAPSMLMSAAMRPSGTGGCAARYCEPSRPCSSAATAAKRMLRLGAFGERGVGAGHARASPPRPRRCPPRRCRWRPRRAWRRSLHAEVVVVRGVEHDLLRRAAGRCRAAGRARSRCGVRSHAVVEGGADTCDAQRHGLEVARSARRHAARRGRWPASASELAAWRPRSSSLHLEARGASVPGSSNCSPVQERLHHLPRVAGAGRGVEDDRPGGADLGGHLVLVVPAAVPEPRPCRRTGPGRPRGRC